MELKSSINKIASFLYKADTAITRATVKSILKSIDTKGLTVEDPSSDTVIIWFDTDTYNKAKKVVKQITQALLQKSPKSNIGTTTTGNKTIIHYKNFQDMGDWNDPSSRHHY